MEVIGVIGSGEETEETEDDEEKDDNERMKEGWIRFGSTGGEWIDTICEGYVAWFGGGVMYREGGAVVGMAGGRRRMECM